MLLTIVLFFCLFVSGYLLYTKRNNIGGKRLPGPTPLPILGNLVSLGFRPHVILTKWAKRYGPIYGIKLGLKDAIIINDYKLIKEIFNETSSTGRLDDNPVLMEVTKGPFGMINSTGSTWEAQRKFTIRTLRTFGFDKSSMESMILDELEIMLNWIGNQKGCVMSGTQLFNAPVLNALWRVVSGERCEWEKGRATLLDAVSDFFKELMNVSTNGLLFAPFLRFIAPRLFGWNRYIQSTNKVFKLFQQSIVKHEETFDSTDLRDFIDHHLMEIKKSTDPKSSFYSETGYANLTASIFELFLGGSQTIASSLSWLLLYLSENESAQNLLQREIDEEIGSTIPSLSHRLHMPYSEAVISEILRITSIVPLGIPHQMRSDLVFRGYHLPKGATVFSNIYAVHHDPNIWGDPECFRPNRFLNEDGTKFVQNKALIPFAEGKRKCIGDSFARDNLFLFLTSICQNFSILPDPNKKEKANFEPHFGLMLSPMPFSILMVSRKT